MVLVQEREGLALFRSPSLTQRRRKDVLVGMGDCPGEKMETGEKCLPVFVNDDRWPLDTLTRWKLLPQVHAGVQVTVFKVTSGHLQKKYIKINTQLQNIYVR